MDRSGLFAPAILAASLCGLGASPAIASCAPGQRVLVAPYNRLGMVTNSGEGSCRIHYDDASVPDDWQAPYMFKSASAPARDRAMAAAGVRSGRYNITVGAGSYNGYLIISGSSYELFLPGGRSAGSGRFLSTGAGS